MKKAIKIILIVFSVFVVFILGFVVTLQLFEFRPEDETILEIRNSDESFSKVKLETSIKVLTFNIGYASLSETEDFVMDGGKKGKMDNKSGVENNIEGIKSILSGQNSDIYLLQEVDLDSKRSYNINQYNILHDYLAYNSSLAYNYRSIFVPFPINPKQMMGKVNSGIATFSNFEVSDALRVQLPGSFPWPVRLANLKRCLLVSRLPIQGSNAELVIINVHLSAYDDGSMRLEEMEALQTLMNEESVKGNYVLVGGDFNQSFPDALSSYESQSDYQYKEAFKLSDDDFWEAFPLNPKWFNENNYQLLVDSLVPTCRLLHQPYDTSNRANNQYYLIDGFIVSDNISVESVQTIDQDFKYSDHNPVKISLKLNN